MDNQHPIRLPTVLLTLPQVIAARQWFRPIKIESCASHLGISEDEVLTAMDSPEYVEAVGNLMLTTRSPENLRKWIETEMPSNFGERMGLSEAVVSELIEKVLDRLSFAKSAGCI